MFFVVQFTDKKHRCALLEGYTNNEFILRQYTRMLSSVFPNTSYMVETEAISEEELLVKYDFYKSQRFRIYKSVDDMTVVYCNPLFMNEWLGSRSNLNWDLTNRLSVNNLMTRFLDASIWLFQITYRVIPESRAERYLLFNRLIARASRAIDDTFGVIDPVKLLAYVNDFPKENEV